MYSDTNFNSRIPSEKVLNTSCAKLGRKNEERKDTSNFFNNYVDRDMGFAGYDSFLFRIPEIRERELVVKEKLYVYLRGRSCLSDGSEPGRIVGKRSR